MIIVTIITNSSRNYFKGTTSSLGTTKRKQRKEQTYMACNSIDSIA